ncbi:hypothetical protein MSLAZ_0830 [Methanosarcina lacustris Z-7289]|uniref:Uncharacterized protein n=1 Tax=Methanosarcina lacustris Z-7289 TaxID=1434111 RepID=A0A0E3S1W8_9EURY|nr:hypothetical protein [Methanosarcina lacustris]AKB74091.1 hypothetical protein MSLAZ_0830 [Methanosarcina lacustris Z-7289]
MSRNKITISILLLVMLVGMALIPATSAQEELTVSEKPSEWEQGLIDALNSNTKSLSTDDIILNYCEANKYNISKNNIINNDIDSEKNNSRTYQLKDESTITFTDLNYFFISGIEEEANNKTVIKNVAAAKSYSYTPMITAYKHFYAISGLRIFSVYAKGYFGYDGDTVTAYHYDSWYSRGFASIWQVSDWEEGGYDYSIGTLSEVYGRGYFHYGIEIEGIGLVIQDLNVEVKTTCDEDGNYASYWSAN